MTERPILFSGEMVRAILAGRKSQTRRPVKPQPPAGWERHCWVMAPIYGWTAEPVPAATWHEVRCPFGYPGDRLWLRETWSIDSEHFEGQGTGFWLRWRADEAQTKHSFDGRLSTKDNQLWKWADRGWRPSIHMPRWASRITLEVTGVRVERLGDIDESDARAEGAPEIAHDYGDSHRLGFELRWDEIYGKSAPWSSNPWVWCVEFKRAE